MTRKEIRQEIDMLLITCKPKLRFKDAERKGVHKFIDIFLHIISAWQLASYMHRITTFFGTIWYPSEAAFDYAYDYWPEHLLEVLKHEIQHDTDERRFPVFYHLSYVFLLPCGITFRAIWEWRAYKVGMETQRRVWSRITESDVSHIVRQFTSSSYFWMFPFKRFMTKIVSKYAAHLNAMLF